MADKKELPRHPGLPSSRIRLLLKISTIDFPSSSESVQQHKKTFKEDSGEVSKTFWSINCCSWAVSRNLHWGSSTLDWQISRIYVSGWNIAVIYLFTHIPILWEQVITNGKWGRQLVVWSRIPWDQVRSTFGLFQHSRDKLETEGNRRIRTPPHNEAPFTFLFLPGIDMETLAGLLLLTNRAQSSS